MLDGKLGVGMGTRLGLEESFSPGFNYQPVALGLLNQSGHLPHRADPHVVDPGQHVSLEETIPVTHNRYNVQTLL